MTDPATPRVYEEQEKSPSWSEGRNGELFLVFATKAAGGWQFYERSTYEVKWYKCAATPGRIAKIGTLGGAPRRNGV